MKKVFCILSILTIISPALAEGELTVYQTSAASAAYVQGAYNAVKSITDALSNSKQDKITVSQGTGATVTSVSLNADGKTVNVARTNETTIPVGSNNSATRAKIWVQ